MLCWYSGTSIPYREEDDRGTYRLRPGQRAEWETSSADIEEGALHVPKVGKYKAAVLPTGMSCKWLPYCRISWDFDSLVRNI